MKNTDFFYCYSINLLRFLRTKGLNNVLKGLNANTNRNFWVFARTNDFEIALSEFTNNKRKNILK